MCKALRSILNTKKSKNTQVTSFCDRVESEMFMECGPSSLETTSSLSPVLEPDQEDISCSLKARSLNSEITTSVKLKNRRSIRISPSCQICTLLFLSGYLASGLIFSEITLNIGVTFLFIDHFCFSIPHLTYFKLPTTFYFYLRLNEKLKSNFHMIIEHLKYNFHMI
jgi:hypothetical protein